MAAVSSVAAFGALGGAVVQKSAQLIQSEAIQLAALSGEKFKDLYYTIYDSQREFLFHFFRPHSVVVWNGTKLNLGQGLKDLAAFFKALPPSKHEVQSFDAQPILVADQKHATVSAGGGNASAMLLTVYGVVKWGLEQKPIPFHHTFVMERDMAVVAQAAAQAAAGTATQPPNTYYVASAVFRNSHGQKAIVS